MLEEAGVALYEVLVNTGLNTAEWKASRVAVQQRFRPLYGE